MPIRLSTAIIPLARERSPDPALRRVAGTTALSEAIAEARGAGAERIVVVTGPAPVPELASEPGIEIVRQKQANGIGGAVLAAAPIGGHGPIAVLLPDDLISGGACLASMAEAYLRGGSGHMVATCDVAEGAVRRHGIVDPLTTIGLGPVFRIIGIVEKPEPALAPSRIAACGRYILHPRILEDLARAVRNRGEAGLTEGIASGIPRVGLCGFSIQGRRFDCSDAADLAAARAALSLPRLRPAAE